MLLGLNFLIAFLNFSLHILGRTAGLLLLLRQFSSPPFATPFWGNQTNERLSCVELGQNAYKLHCLVRRHVCCVWASQLSLSSQVLDSLVKSKFLGFQVCQGAHPPHAQARIYANCFQTASRRVIKLQSTLICGFYFFIRLSHRIEGRILNLLEWGGMIRIRENFKHAG